jgi:hypothetical protein
METQEMCKNSEGDPAKPDLAATTCWRRFRSMIYVGVCIRLGQIRFLAPLIRPRFVES